MKPAPLDTDRLIGDRYVLETMIAQGGMGEVWRARHKALKSLVAIKFLHRASSFSQSTRKRFLTEAQVTANLKTRHAVQVFDFGVTDDGLPYLVMEYLEGETLEKRIAREGRLSPEATVMILRQAARALDRAHALGIVHRDFKPENIIILADEEGGEHVKVVDFGIAKILGDLAEVGPVSESYSINHAGSGTVTNTAVGTPYYMAPEQVQDSSKVGPAADIWAFGVVAYECLTGKRPYDDESIPMLLARLVTRERAPAASTRADVPAAFDDWFDVACAGDQEDRFPDAQTAVMSLATALDLPGVTAIPSRTSMEVTPPPLVKRAVSPLAATLDARKSGRPPKMSTEELLLDPTPPPSEPARAALPPPPALPASLKVHTTAPIEPAPRLSRAGRPTRGPLSLVLIGGVIALAATTIAVTRRTPAPAAASSAPITSVLAPTLPPSASAVEQPSAAPNAPSVASAPSAVTSADEPATSASAPLAATVAPPSGRLPSPVKKTAAPAKSAPSAFRLPPLGL